MLHAGLDLSRKRLDYCLLDRRGRRVELAAAPPDLDGLVGLARRVEQRHGRVPVRAAIESMNGARFVHDTLEHVGWEVEVADAQKVKGLAPLACKTDKIDAWVLAELSGRELVPAIWLPAFELRTERKRARFRLFLVRKRSSLKHRRVDERIRDSALKGRAPASMSLARGDPLSGRGRASAASAANPRSRPGNTAVPRAGAGSPARTAPLAVGALDWVAGAVREVGGEVIKHTGDGFFAAFQTAAAALEAAVAIQRALDEHEPFAPDVRIGVHTGGAFHRHEDDYAGQGVHMAARIGALAGAGEILVSADSVDGGSKFALSEPRSELLKGFDEPVELGWR